ncbi:hypothetical protein FRC03_005842 [Tulasnella sp. 419]|nr:hypothetical protein FRC03_005842 [Tulasnella sp. 419]
MAFGRWFDWMTQLGRWPSSLTVVSSRIRSSRFTIAFAILSLACCAAQLGLHIHIRQETFRTALFLDEVLDMVDADSGVVRPRPLAILIPDGPLVACRHLPSIGGSLPKGCFIVWSEETDGSNGDNAIHTTVPVDEVRSFSLSLDLPTFTVILDDPINTGSPRGDGQKSDDLVPQEGGRPDQPSGNGGGGIALPAVIDTSIPTSTSVETTFTFTILPDLGTSTSLQTTPTEPPRMGGSLTAGISDPNSLSIATSYSTTQSEPLLSSSISADLNSTSSTTQSFSSAYAQSTTTILTEITTTTSETSFSTASSSESVLPDSTSTNTDTSSTTSTAELTTSTSLLIFTPSLTSPPSSSTSSTTTSSSSTTSSSTTSSSSSTTSSSSSTTSSSSSTTSSSTTSSSTTSSSTTSSSTTSSSTSSSSTSTSSSLLSTASSLSSSSSFSSSAFFTSSSSTSLASTYSTLTPTPSSLADTTSTSISTLQPFDTTEIGPPTSDNPTSLWSTQTLTSETTTSSSLTTDLFTTTESTSATAISTLPVGESGTLNKRNSFVPVNGFRSLWSKRGPTLEAQSDWDEDGQRVTTIKIEGLNDAPGGSVDVVLINMRCATALNWPRDVLARTLDEEAAFIALQSWAFILSISAMYYKSVSSLAVVVILYLTSMVWSAYGISRTQTFERDFSRVITKGACGGVSLLPNYFHRERAHEIPILLLSIFFLISVVFISFRLFKEFGSAAWRHTEQNWSMRRAYVVRTTLKATIKLSLLITTTTSALWLDQLYLGPASVYAPSPKVYQGIFTLTAILLLVWLLTGLYAVFKELRKTIVLFGVLSLPAAAVWIGMFTSTVYQVTFLIWGFFASLSIVSCIFTIAILLLSIQYRLDINKGLDHFLQAQEYREYGSVSPQIHITSSEDPFKDPESWITPTTGSDTLPSPSTIPESIKNPFADRYSVDPSERSSRLYQTSSLVSSLPSAMLASLNSQGSNPVSPRYTDSSRDSRDTTSTIQQVEQQLVVEKSETSHRISPFSDDSEVGPRQRGKEKVGARRLALLKAQRKPQSGPPVKKFAFGLKY